MDEKGFNESVNITDKKIYYYLEDTLLILYIYFYSSIFPFSFIFNVNLECDVFRATPVFNCKLFCS